MSFPIHRNVLAYPFPELACIKIILTTMIFIKNKGINRQKVTIIYPPEFNINFRSHRSLHYFEEYVMHLNLLIHLFLFFVFLGISFSLDRFGHLLLLGFKVVCPFNNKAKNKIEQHNLGEI